MNVESKASKLTGMDALAQMRDELRVKIHLARLEARSEWERLEPKWWELEAKIDALETASAETAKGMKAAVELMIDELHKGYERIRTIL